MGHLYIPSIHDWPSTRPIAILKPTEGPAPAAQKEGTELTEGEGTGDPNTPNGNRPPRCNATDGPIREKTP